MKNRYFVLILLLFFLLEGALFPWLLPFPRTGGLLASPRLVMVGILFVSMFRHRHIGLLLGLVFGFMHDIVYDSPMIGAHGFSMAIAAYAAGSVSARIKAGMALSFTILTFGLAICETSVYSLYRLFQVIDLPLSDFLARQFAPSLLLNLLLAVLLYVPARKRLETVPDKRDEETA